MKTLYVLGVNQEIIGEVQYRSTDNEYYFCHTIAHAFNTSLNNIITKEQYNKNNNIYMCVVCDKNAVDVLDGYDTCPDCVAIQKLKSGWTLESREDFINKTKHLRD